MIPGEPALEERRYIVTGDAERDLRTMTYLAKRQIASLEAPEETHQRCYNEWRDFLEDVAKHYGMN